MDNTISVPFEISDVPSEVNEELLSAFTGERIGFLHVGPKKYLLASEYREQAAGFYNMELRSDDIWIVTFPRSGTTWTQELLWLVNNDLDFETALKTNLVQRFPFIDLSTITCEPFKREIVEKNKMDRQSEEEYRRKYIPGYQNAANMKSPRHLKSHLPLSLLPPKLLDTCKVVYVARNPKDVAVSCYYQNRLLKDIGYENDFENYWDLFQRDLVLWAPFWSHVEEAWQKRNHPNMLFLFYEDMKKDLPGAITKVATFLNKNIPEEQMQKLVHHLSIDNFRKNPAMKFLSYQIPGTVKEGEQGFIRQGKSGTWKKEFSSELNKKADEWIREHEKHTDLRFQL